MPLEDTLEDKQGSTEAWKHLGNTSKKYESGGRGPGAINEKGAKLDKGGMSYGLYQMSEKGTVQQYQKYTKYQELKGLKPGTSEFNRAWKAAAKQDPEGFAKEQHAFIKKNYYDRENSRLKRKGMDFSNRGRGIQDMIWSTSVQYGNRKIIEDALQGQNVNAMSDAQNRRIDMTKKFFLLCYMDKMLELGEKYDKIVNHKR